MILVCPSCKAKFKVPDGAIPPEGRKVRCAKCKHSWHATSAHALKPRPAAPVQPASRPQPSAAAMGAMGAMDTDLDAGLAARTAQMRRELGSAPLPPEPTAAPPADNESFDEDEDFGAGISSGLNDRDASVDDTGDDFGVGSALRDHLSEVSDEIDALAEDDYDMEAGAEGDDEEDAYDDDDFLARRRAEQRRQGERDAKARMRRVVVIGWALLLVAVLSLALTVVFGRETLTEKWPASKVLYRWVDGSRTVDKFHPGTGGKPLTKPITEAKEKLQASLEPPKVEERDGKMALVLTGYVENMGERAANVPQLEIRITDRDGNVLDSWTFDPPGLVLRRGSRLPFEQTRSPIPIGAAKAEVKVLEGTKSETRAE